MGDLSNTELAMLVATCDREATRIEAQALCFRHELTEARGRVTSLEREIADIDARAAAARDEAMAAMVAAGVKSVTHLGIEYALRDSPGRVVIDNEKAFKVQSNRFVNVKQVEQRTVDRKALGQALRKGEVVPGARIEKTRNLIMCPVDAAVLSR